MFFLSVVLGLVLVAGKTTNLNWDRLLPKFHFHPNGHWMNDPNAPLRFKSKSDPNSSIYHLFYQFNPNGNHWATINWGHAFTTDLINWEILPIAIRNDSFYDSAGAWSGSAVMHHNIDTNDDEDDEDDNGVSVLQIFYTGVQSRGPETYHEWEWNETQSTAFSIIEDSDNPQFLNFTKSMKPIIDTPPLDRLRLNHRSQLTGFRDPFFFRHGNDSYVLIGSGVANNSGLVLLYKADHPTDALLYSQSNGTNVDIWKDMFVGFTYLGILAHDLGNIHFGTEYLADVWECPQLYALPYLCNGQSSSSSSTTVCYRHILQFSNDFNALTMRNFNNFKRDWRKVLYLSGDFDSRDKMQWNDTYLTNLSGTTEIFDGSSRYYAAALMYDDTSDDMRSEHLIFGWIDEDRMNYTFDEAQWAGVHAIPRRVWWCDDSGLNNFSSNDGGLPQYLCKMPIDNLKQLRDKLYWNETMIIESDSTDYNDSNKCTPVETTPFINNDTNTRRQFDIEMTINTLTTNVSNSDSVDHFRFCFYVNPDFSEYTCLFLDFDKGRLYLNRTLSTDISSTDDYEAVNTYPIYQNFTDGLSDYLDASDGALLWTIRIILDESVAEIFLNNGIMALTTRIYPLHNASVLFLRPVLCYKESGNRLSSPTIGIVNTQIWGMKAANISDFEFHKSHKKKYWNNHTIIKFTVGLVLGVLVFVLVIYFCRAAIFSCCGKKRGHGFYMMNQDVLETFTPPIPSPVSPFNESTSPPVGSGDYTQPTSKPEIKLFAAE